MLEGWRLRWFIARLQHNPWAASLPADSHWLIINTAHLIHLFTAQSSTSMNGNDWEASSACQKHRSWNNSFNRNFMEWKKSILKMNFSRKRCLLAISVNILFCLSYTLRLINSEVIISCPTLDKTHVWSHESFSFMWKGSSVYVQWVFYSATNWYSNMIIQHKNSEWKCSICFYWYPVCSRPFLEKYICF